MTIGNTPYFCDALLVVAVIAESEFLAVAAPAEIARLRLFNFAFAESAFDRFHSPILTMTPV
jgi:hypothetical protein